MPGPNYGWFQFRLHVEAADLYRTIGEAAVRRLWDAFCLDNAALSTVLGDRVDPGLAAFARSF